MKTIYLLRHGHSPQITAEHGGDHERPLSAEGRIQVQNAALYLTHEKLGLDIILSSDARRCAETAAEIAAKLPPKKKGILPGLYLAGAGQILDDIRGVEEIFSSAMIVAHNPGIAQLALSFGHNNEQALHNFAPATLAVFETSSESWANISSLNTRLKNVVTP